MGEYADDAIDRAFTDEEMRLAYEDNELDFEEAYDYGIIDEKGFAEPSPYSVPAYDEQALRIEISNAMLAFAPKHELTWVQNNQQSNPISASLVEICKKYKIAWEMRLGMAKTLRESGHSLSIKQRAWIQTNWKGGYKEFVALFGTKSKKSDKVYAELKKLTNLIIKVANDRPNPTKKMKSRST